MSELEQFLEAVREERKTFVEAINTENWNTRMRTQAESLIVIFDQMSTRLESKVVDEKMDDVTWKEKYFDLLDKWKHFKPAFNDTEQNY